MPSIAAPSLRRSDFAGDFAHPVRAAHAGMAGFRNDQRALIAPAHGIEQLRQRGAARIVELPAQRPLRAEFPLVAPVIIDADDIEVARTAAEFRARAAAQHVPRFELQFALLLDG